MRRLLAAAILGAALLGGALLGTAGCSSAGQSDGAAASGPGATASGSAAPPAGGAPAAGASGTATGNAGQVCAAARRLSTEKVTAFVDELGNMLTASGAGDTAAAGRAERAAAAAIRQWSAGLRAEAGKADDARLAKVLQEMAVETATMTADIDSIDDARLDDLQQRLDALCGA